MTLRLWIGSAIVVALALCAGTSSAVEPWADPRLPPVDGLALWLDAGQVNAARQARREAPLEGDAPLTQWPDGSGAARDVAQAETARQPRLVKIKAADSPDAGQIRWVVRFDGRDDVLLGALPEGQARDATLFVVAAPHSNGGGSRGLFSSSAPDRRDFETGWNVDLGLETTLAFRMLNVEGRSFPGARNLLKKPVPFGSLQILEAKVDSAAKRVTLAVDGAPTGKRPSSGEDFHLEVVALGARLSGAGQGSDPLQGFFHGDIAELLLFRRALSAEDSTSVTRYLREKHAALGEALPREIARAPGGDEIFGSPGTREIPELAGGNWGRGRRVFFSDEAACGKCHALQGAGGRTGPDLSNLIQRDYASVLRDIAQPSAAIHPDYVTQVVTLTDGRVLTGVLRTEGDRLQVGDRDGGLTSLRKDEVKSSKPSDTSIMRERLLDRLGPEKTRDLLAFLLRPAPRMPTPRGVPPMPLRRRAEVRNFLAGGEPVTDRRPLRLLLVAGKKDHGAGEHDYPAWLRVWNELLSAAEQVTVDTAMEWPTGKQLDGADVIVFYQKGEWNAERQAALDAHLGRGRGLVYLHWAIEGGAGAGSFAERIGLASDAAQTAYRHGPVDLVFDRSRSHPIARNFERIQLVDESYWKLVGNPNRMETLVSAVEDSEPRPLCWTVEQERGKGRVFVSVPGHYSWTFDDPVFRTLVLRGIAWGARDNVDRFNDLVLPGARVAD